MPALVLTAPHALALRETPVPTPGPGEYLVKIHAAGICGTDLHAFCGDHPMMTYPRVMGHELSGTLIGGDGPLPLGTEVVVNPMLTCGHCRPCRLGRRNCCVDMQVLGVHLDGGFRDALLLPNTMVHALPPTVPLEYGALVEPLSIGANACARGEVKAGDKVLILGAGTIGLCCLLLAKAKGAEVMIADPLPARLARATAMGADEVVVTGVDDDQAKVIEWTDWDGPDVVIEAAGRMDALRRAFDLVAAAGIVVSLAITAEELSLPVTRTIVRKELDFRGSRLNRDLFGEVLELLAAGKLDPSGLITHRFPLAMGGQAFAACLAQPEQVVKVVLRMP